MIRSSEQEAVMAEQDPTPEYDPTDYTVDQVNDYLATADDTERQRVLDAEAAGQNRKGIVGTDTPTEAPTDARTAQQQAAAESGVFGDVAGPDHPDAVKPADQSAPDTPAESGTVGHDGDLATDAPATIQDQEAPDLDGEHYQRGYVGTLPDADNRPDLTLQGVLGQNRA